MKTDLIYCKDKYDELFTSVINLLEDGSLIPSSQLSEFIEILETARSKANFAIRRIIRKSEMSLNRKVELEQLHKEN